MITTEEASAGTTLVTSTTTDSSGSSTAVDRVSITRCAFGRATNRPPRARPVGAGT
jgi:hypothetical protein